MNYLQMIPVIFDIIKAIEAAMPNSPGKEKFDAAFAALTQIFGDLAAQAPQRAALITVFVNGLTVAGIFKKKSA
jgi:hypothetical protein